ncbi:hypothetical protein FQN57_002166 [Myotisia sp. PD_48]|nr:hypothetical protein FQN57_002166 [Myotisia sp. PD_48]
MSGPSLKRRKLSAGNDADDNSQDIPSESHSTKRNGVQQPASSSRTTVAEYALASGQYKSSLFKLQMDELLSQLRPDHDKLRSRVEKQLRQLKTVIENIPDRAPLSLADAKKELERAGIAIPFTSPSPGKDTRYTFQYLKPADINVVGSFSLKTVVKSAAKTTIDLAVTIPSAIFQKKDYVSYRYFHKRSYYLACIASALQNEKDKPFKLSYDFQDGNTLRPILLVEPGQGADDEFTQAKCCIRIITAVQSGTFLVSNTLPSHNNLRHDTQDESEHTNTSKATTHIYNASLRSEAVVSAYLKLHHSASTRCAAFRDSCILGRAWLRQRGFGTSFAQGGFGHFEWATLLSLLLEGGGPNGKPILSPSYSSYQIFKAALQFLAGRDLTSPLLLHSTETSQSIACPGFPAIFDGDRGLNIIYKMTPWSYSLLRRESSLALKMLNDLTHNPFDNLFITRVYDPICRYDQAISVTFSERQPQTLQMAQRLQSLHSKLIKALGDRAFSVGFSLNEPQTWLLNSSPTKGRSSWVLIIGLNLDPNNQNRIVDHGPSVEDKEDAAAFREFWGEKAELRRFKDGSIVESLVWSDHISSTTPVQQIVSYVLHRHFAIDPDKITCMGEGLAKVVSDMGIALRPTSGTNEVLEAYQTLEKHLQSLDNLPLTFSQLSMASPSIRWSPKSSICSPIDLILRFQASSRWPSDLRAIQMTKLALLLNVSDSLHDMERIHESRIGTENLGNEKLNCSYLEIHCSSIIFRLRIFHESEQAIIERQLKDRESPIRLKEELAIALASHKATFVQSPRHAQAIQTLSTRFPFLAPTIQIFKAWASSHLFLTLVHESLLELLVCQVFLKPYPWEVPSGAFVAFLRTLQLLSRWDWQYEPMIIDFNDELNPQDVADIQTRFHARRKIDPAMKNVALFVASNVDRDGVTWTQAGQPPRVVASRISVLAKAACKLVRDKGAELQISDLFRSSLTDYDFILHLQANLVMSGRSRYKNLDNSMIADDERTKSESILAFVQELNALYGENMILFHGSGNQRVIAGLWNPVSTKPRPFGLKVSFSSLPRKDKEGKEEVSLNKTAILNEIASIAGDIISSIQVVG